MISNPCRPRLPGLSVEITSKASVVEYAPAQLLQPLTFTGKPSVIHGSW